MKEAKSIGQRAQGKGHRAKGRGHRAKGRVQRAETKRNSVGRKESGEARERLSEEANKRRREQATERMSVRAAGCLITIGFKPETLNFKPVLLPPAGRQETRNFEPETLNFKLRTRMPPQVLLSGSRYKNASQLPREGFNSGACPGAAAITRIPSISSHRATLPGDTRHPKCRTGPITGCKHNKFLGQKVWEGLPMN